MRDRRPRIKMSRNDYIAEIQVVFGGGSVGVSDKLPEEEGWELVTKSASGKSANLNKVRGVSCHKSNVQVAVLVCFLYNKAKRVRPLPPHYSTDGLQLLRTSDTSNSVPLPRALPPYLSFFLDRPIIVFSSRHLLGTAGWRRGTAGRTASSSRPR